MSKLRSEQFFQPVNLSGSFTGSLLAIGPLSGSFTGSLQGTASWAISASRVTSASFASNARLLNNLQSSEFARVGTANTFNGNQIIQGNITSSGNALIQGNINILGTASLAFLNATTVSSSIIFTSGSNILGNNRYIDTQTLIGTVYITGSVNALNSITAPSFIGTASWAGNASQALTSSYVDGNIFNDTNPVLSASYADIAENANTASYVDGNIFNDTNPVLSSSYALTASFITSSRVFGPSGANSVSTSSLALVATLARTASVAPNYFPTGGGVINGTASINYSNTNTINTLGGNSHINLINSNNLGQTVISFTNSNRNTLTGKIRNDYDGNLTYMTTGSLANHYFLTNGETNNIANIKMFISSSGNIGMGNGFTAPKNTLHVNGGITSNSITASFISASNNFIGTLQGTSSWAVSASQALTASFLLGTIANATNAISASYAATASRTAGIFGVTGPGAQIYRTIPQISGSGEYANNSWIKLGVTNVNTFAVSIGTTVIPIANQFLVGHTTVISGSLNVSGSTILRGSFSGSNGININGIPNASSNVILGYNVTTGQFTYLPTSSLGVVTASYSGSITNVVGGSPGQVQYYSTTATAFAGIPGLTYNPAQPDSVLALTGTGSFTGSFIGTYNGSSSGDFNGTISATGSLSGSFTGSLLGTSSYTLNASQSLSSSYSLTSLTSLNAASSSWAIEALNNVETASVTSNTIIFTKGNSSQFSITVDTGSGAGFPFTGDASIIGSLTVAGNGRVTIDDGLYTQTITSSYISASSGIIGDLTGTSSWAESASVAPDYLPLIGGTITGNVTINGTAYINYLNVSTVESASVIYSSGSNILGDATNDTQTLIGTVKVSGSQQITGSLSVLGAVSGSSFTGSLLGTASFATSASRAVTSSYALTSSYSTTLGASLSQPSNNQVRLLSSNGSTLTTITVNNVTSASYADNTSVANSVSGGTINYIPIFGATGNSSLGSSTIQQSGDNIGINRVPSTLLDVNGDTTVRGKIYQPYSYTFSDYSDAAKGDSINLLSVLANSYNTVILDYVLQEYSGSGTLIGNRIGTVKVGVADSRTGYGRVTLTDQTNQSMVVSSDLAGKVGFSSTENIYFSGSIDAFYNQLILGIYNNNADTTMAISYEAKIITNPFSKY
jgi:hypothetical protein